VTSLNVSLPEPMKKFIETEVKRGGYSTPSEYVRALVRAEQKRLAEDHLERLLINSPRSGGQELNLEFRDHARWGKARGTATG